MENIMIKTKSKKALKILTIIFTIIGFALFAICFSLFLNVLKNYDAYKNPETNNLNTGLTMAFTVVLYIIFGAPQVVISGLSIAFSALTIKRKAKIGIICLFTNILSLIAVITLFVIINIMI